MRYGNLLIEGKVTTHNSAVDAVNADSLLFELGSATTGNANGGSISFKPGAGVGTGEAGSVNIESALALKFFDADSSNHVGFKAASTLAGDVVWTLPIADGTNGQVLKTDGTGELSWVDVATDVYISIAGDTGTATADALNDTITFTGGLGITTVASDVAGDDTLTISFSSNDFTAKTAPIAADKVVIFDSANGDAPVYSTFTNIVNSLNLVSGITANGFVVRTAEDTYASRSIVESTTAGEEGIAITNGDGIAGNPTIGLDVTGLTDGSVTSSTVIPSFDGINNVKITPTEIVASRIVRGTFANAGLTAGVIALGHNLNVTSVLVQIFDELNQMVLPDALTLTDSNTTTVDLSSYGTISGTWSYIVFG